MLQSTEIQHRASFVRVSGLVFWLLPMHNPSIPQISTSATGWHPPVRFVGSSFGYAATASAFLLMAAFAEAQTAAPSEEPVPAKAVESSPTASAVDSPPPADAPADASPSVEPGTIEAPLPESVEPAPDLGLMLDASADLAAGTAATAESAAEAAPADAFASDAAPMDEQDLAAAAEQEPKKFSFRLTGSAVYDDNVSLDSGDPGMGQQSDFILSAGGGFTWRPYTREDRNFSFSYDGTARFYTDHSENNGTDHVVSVGGFLSRGGTVVSLNGNYSSLSGLEMESRQFQDRQIASFGVSLEQRLTGKMTLTAGLDYHTSLYDTLLSNDGVSGRLGVNWALSAKATIGISAAGGYTDSDSNGRQTYESLMLTGGYQSSEKFSMNAGVGVQTGATVGDDAGDDGAHFIFNLGAAYKAGEKTDLSLRLSTGSADTAVRNGGAAASQDLNFNFTVSHRFSDRLSARLYANKTTPASTVEENASINRTAIGAGLTRKLGHNLSLSLDGGYDNSDYVSTTGEDTLDREETGLFLRTALMWRPVDSTTVSLFYDLRDNTSDDESLAYDQNRIGLSVGRIW